MRPVLRTHRVPSRRMTSDVGVMRAMVPPAVSGHATHAHEIDRLAMSLRRVSTPSHSDATLTRCRWPAQLHCDIVRHALASSSAVHRLNN